jgi:4-hydroxy-tetrahydrodipicolinate reductase
MAEAFDAAASDIPLLVAPNTSVGVTLLIELVREAAQALPVEFDIEIVESHHRMKRDAPSGTALALGRAAAQGRKQMFEDSAHSRADGNPRRKGDIGFAVVRGGDIVGDHTVLFAGNGERVSLSHQVTDRAIFARGALQAAAWLAGQGPGRYQMRDLLSYKTEA